jgi:hypothetical protein
MKNIIYEHRDGKVFLIVSTFISSAYFKTSEINWDIMGPLIIDLSSQSSPIEISLDDIKYKCLCIEMFDYAIVCTANHYVIIWF